MGQHHEFDAPALEEKRNDDKIQCQRGFFDVFGSNKKKGTPYFLARNVFIKTITFEQLKTTFVSIFSEPLFDKCLIEPHVNHAMGKLSPSNKLS